MTPEDEDDTVELNPVAAAAAPTTQAQLAGLIEQGVR
jgi:hypothetical protein